MIARWFWAWEKFKLYCSCPFDQGNLSRIYVVPSVYWGISRCPKANSTAPGATNDQYLSRKSQAQRMIIKTERRTIECSSDARQLHNNEQRRLLLVKLTPLLSVLFSIDAACPCGHML